MLSSRLYVLMVSSCVVGLVGVALYGGKGKLRTSCEESVFGEYGYGVYEEDGDWACVVSEVRELLGKWMCVP